MSHSNIDKVDCPRCKGQGWIKLRKKRSLPQNKYYWGVVIMILSAETGEDKDTMHEILRYKFNSEKKILPDNTEVIYGKSTKHLEKNEFEQYLATIRAWAAELNIIIPLPNEVTTEMLIQMEREYNQMFY